MSPRLQSVEPLAEADADRGQVRDRAPHGWLNAKSAAAYLDFPSVRAFRRWAKRAGVVSGRRGRVLMFTRKDLDAAVKVGR